ncbi:hypothetical protein MPH_00946 [Macrophomina phaseolina MS6]|uniref:Gag1-like clamp domain-containing protein n=1 Tax=Macrophomina phaseolina (strain MS6) TaxID=1126212 RepID=K2RGQ6_MACPH|nr:hypothetical protein MPH_00946 [Macrophomina phaseolina MS6]
MDTNQSAARDARRFLTDRVRNDWTFPSIADVHANAAGSRPDATYYDSSVAGGSEDELRGVTQFRERYYGSTDDDDNDDESDGNDDEPEAEQASAAAQAGTAATGDIENEAGGGSKREYKFDSPEHVGRSLEERAQRRKRRRRARLEEEMAWNEGVRCFVRRRDAWTGAASVRKYARRRSRASADMDVEEVEAHRAVDRVLVETASVVEEVVEEKKKKTKGDEDGAAPADKERQTEKRINVDIPASEEPLVPLAPPLLPHNAIRQSITPKAYPDIYGKIVVAGQTPKVPINLAHMTRALVQGWKDDGEWPPRPGPADPLMGRKKVALAGGRVGTLAAVLGGGDGSVGKSAASNSGHHGEFLAHHPHLQKGVESVKKVFRLSGGHHGHSNPSGGIVHDGQPPAS